MRAAGVSLTEVFAAIRASNIDVGARTIEINRVEYVVRGIGYIKSVADIENTVIKVNDNVPILVKNIANVSLGPALRRGALDKEGAEAVGGVVVVRFGANPLEVIKNVKKKIAEIAPGLPKKTLSDGTVSQVKIVPFYDRTGLIYETLGTLNSALAEEILVTVIVIIILRDGFALFLGFHQFQCCLAKSPANLRKGDCASEVVITKVRTYLFPLIDVLSPVFHDFSGLSVPEDISLDDFYITLEFRDCLH